jgi:hypothetical protein
MPNYDFFKNDPSGAKKRLSYLSKHPDILFGINTWAKTYDLEDLSFYEQIYHYCNDLTNRPIDPNTGLLKTFRGPAKGYSVHGKIRPHVKPKKTLASLLIEGNHIDNSIGGSISQKICNDSHLLAELHQLYPYDISVRAKTFMLVNGMLEIPTCKNCGKPTRFGKEKGFLKTCSEFCRRTYEQRFRSKIIDFYGRSVRVQGYEEFVLFDLASVYDPTDILVSDEIIRSIGGPIPYDGGQYYPDLYIKSKNRIVEVKSSYTFKKDYTRNLSKMTGAVNAGYDFEFHIWDKTKILTTNEACNINPSKL